MIREIVTSWLFCACLAFAGTAEASELAVPQAPTSGQTTSHSLRLLSTASTTAYELLTSKWGLRAGVALLGTFCLDPQGWINKGTFVLAAANTYATTHCYSMLSRLKSGTNALRARWKESVKHTSQAFTGLWRQLRKMENTQAKLAQEQRTIQSLQEQSLSLQEETFVFCMQARALERSRSKLGRALTPQEVQTVEEDAKKKAWERIEYRRLQARLRAVAQASQALEQCTTRAQNSQDNNPAEQQMLLAIRGLDQIASSQDTSWGNGVYQGIRGCILRAGDRIGLRQADTTEPTQEQSPAIQHVRTQPAHEASPAPEQAQPTAWWNPIETARQLMWS